MNDYNDQQRKLFIAKHGSHHLEQSYRLNWRWSLWLAALLVLWAMVGHHSDAASPHAFLKSDMADRPIPVYSMPCRRPVPGERLLLTVSADTNGQLIVESCSIVRKIDTAPKITRG